MKKFEAIESLRGYMAWWVVATHAVQLTGTAGLFPQPIALFLANGGWAVRVFMIVSGFVIAHLLLVKDEPYGPYLTRRAMRILPLYAVMVIVNVVLLDPYLAAYVQNAHATGREMRFEKLAEEAHHWFLHVPLHLTALHGIVPDSALKYASSAYLTPAWSISLEWQFYLLAPFIVSAMRKLDVVGGVVLGTCLLMSGAALSGVLGQWKYESFIFIALPFFLVGVCSRLLFSGGLSWPAILATTVSGLIFIAMKHSLTSLAGYLVVGAIWLVFCGFAARESGLVRFGGKAVDRLIWLLALNPLATAFGRVSYSTYLAHIPIFSIVVGGGILASGRTDQPFVIALTLLAMVLVIPASFALHRWVEAPGNRLGSKLAARMNARAPLDARPAKPSPVK